MTTIAAPGPVEREFTVRSRSQLQLALRRFARNPLAMVGLASFLTMMVAAFAGPRLLPFGYDQQTDTLSAPPGTDGHVFGTDTLGRDVLALTLRGIQWSMLMCAVFVVVACILGMLVGALAGYLGGMVDDLLMRSVDITLTVPFFAVVLVLTAAFPSARSPVGVALLIALSSWMALARIVRAQFLSLREREYVDAARALGASGRRIVLRHLVPNSLGEIMVWLTLGATAAVGTEATLSFLGYGVQGSEVSLGRLVAEGAAAAESRPWLFYFPGSRCCSSCCR
jgi:ABC-type dipeptide/oligopeptide/nickel transport system permease subunit